MMLLKEKINKDELILTMVNQLNLFLESHNRLIELTEKKNLTYVQTVVVERYAITRHYYEDCWKKSHQGRNYPYFDLQTLTQKITRDYERIEQFCQELNNN